MTPILDPAVPAGAYDELRPGALPRARTQRERTPADGPLPALYLSHGAPPLFDDGPWLRQLFGWAQSQSMTIGARVRVMRTCRTAAIAPAAGSRVVGAPDLHSCRG